MNFERGIRKSLQYAGIGFAIPAIVIALIAIYHFTFHEIHPMDRENDLARLPALILIPSFGLALLFGLSAFASVAPNHGLSFIRSLIVVAGATVMAVLATQPRLRRKTVDPDAWLETAIPIAVALITTLAILIYSRRTTPQNGCDELSINLRPNRDITNG